jgi:Protein of unknown function (DUF1097)
MGLIPALAISIGALAAVITFLFLGPLAGLGLSVWAAFIAWATFYHCGGKEAGLQKTVTHNIFGSVLAWIALLLITQIPLAGSIGLPLWAGICVGVTVFVLVFAASNPALSDIPASVYGYAPVAAYALLATKLDTLTSASLTNPLINVVVSMIIGAVFGYVSEKIAGALAKS